MASTIKLSVTELIFEKLAESQKFKYNGTSISGGYVLVFKG